MANPKHNRKACWYYFYDESDGCTTWTIQFGTPPPPANTVTTILDNRTSARKRYNEYDSLIECQTEAHAHEIVTLLNKVKAGPDMNFAYLQKWQVEQLRERNNTRADEESDTSDDYDSEEQPIRSAR
jgi:hypothetical protein